MLFDWDSKCSNFHDLFIMGIYHMNGTRQTRVKRMYRSQYLQRFFRISYGSADQGRFIRSFSIFAVARGRIPG